MKKIFSLLIKSVLAGIMIAVGGTVFLSVDNKVIGAIFFAIGLFMIVVRSFNLYTGKVGYIFDNGPKYLIEVLIAIIGNFIGTFLVGFILKFTRIYNEINIKAINLVNVKLCDNILSIFVLSVMCGLLMFLAVDGYKTINDSLGKYLAVFLGVIVFILCGFEHSIANMYYFSVANVWNTQVFGYLGIMILGNAIGGNIIPIFNKLNNFILK